MGEPQTEQAGGEIQEGGTVNNEGYLQKQLYGIGIFEEEIVLSDFTGDGERRFVVTQEQLMQFFHTELTFRPFPGLVWMKKGGNAETYLITLPASERTILYRKGHSPKRKSKGKLTALKMKFPSLALKVRVDSAGRKINGIEIWGFSGAVLKPDTVLYELPLPNLSGSRMCLGSTHRATDGNVRKAAEKTVFDTPFNWHNNIVGIGQIPFYDYHKKYGGRCPFKTLNKLGTGKQLLEAKA